MKHTVITIGRQNGSGGREIGEKLAKSLNIPFYDKLLLQKTAEQSGFAPHFVEQNDEKKPGFFWGMGTATWPYDQPISFRLYLEQSKIITELAQKESCVIVGRCADFVLAGNPDLFSVFIHAPLEHRVERVAARENISAAKAKTLIARRDKSRAAYYNYFTDHVWGAADCCQLSIDSSMLGVDGTVELLLDILRRRNGN